MTKITKEPVGSFSPYYGCAIMAMAVMVFGGIVLWSLYTLNQQDSEIAKFTVDEPVPLLRSVLPSAEQAAFKTTLAAFASAATSGKPATLSLNVAELNTLIDLAPDTGYGNFKVMIAVKALKPDDTVVADVCLPLNRIKYWEGKRYAVGEATFVTEIAKDGGGPDLRLASLKVPGKEVSPGFMDAFSTWEWLTPYRKLPSLEPVMKTVKKVTVTANAVVISTVP